VFVTGTHTISKVDATFPDFTFLGCAPLRLWGGEQLVLKDERARAPRPRPMAAVDATLEALETRCVRATFAVKASIIHEVYAREVLWKEKYRTFHRLVVARGKTVYGYASPPARA
jgi:hypothetical protein